MHLIFLKKQKLGRALALLPLFGLRLYQTKSDIGSKKNLGFSYRIKKRKSLSNEYDNPNKSNAIHHFSSYLRGLIGHNKHNSYTRMVRLAWHTCTTKSEIIVMKAF